MVDLQDQPEGSYVLIVVSESGHRYSMFIDNYVVYPKIIEFRRRDGVRLLTLPVDSTWTVVNREYVEIMSMEQLTILAKQDQEARDSLVESVFPKQAVDKESQDKPSLESIVFPNETQPFPERMYR